jgi:hypothetical protein
MSLSIWLRHSIHIFEIAVRRLQAPLNAVVQKRDDTIALIGEGSAIRRLKATAPNPDGNGCKPERRLVVLLEKNTLRKNVLKKTCECGSDGRRRCRGVSFQKHIKMTVR